MRKFGEWFAEIKNELLVNSLTILICYIATCGINELRDLSIGNQAFEEEQKLAEIKKYKKAEFLKEKNNQEQINNATEYEQLESVKPEIKFKNPPKLDIEVEQYGGRILKVIEFEGDVKLKIDNPILQKALQIAARKVVTNRWRMSIIYTSSEILIVEKTPANKAAEIKELVSRLGLNVSFTPFTGIVGKKAVTEADTNTNAKEDRRPLGSIRGVLNLEQQARLIQELKINLGDGVRIVGLNEASPNISAILEVANGY